MSNKVEITLLESINANDSAAVLSINNNFLALRDALNNTLSRDGTSPNYMDDVLDMNSYRIINTAEPTYDSDYVTLGWLKANYGDIASYAERAEAAANSAEAAYSNIRELATIVSNDAQGVIDIINDFESETLTNYYTKSETNTLLNAKADTATTLTGYGISDAYTKAEVNTALAGKANVATTLAGYGITDGANTALSNLNSNGRMIVESQNGTISNCVLEIPQNIKCELSGTTYTLKAGSVRVKLGETYTTQTVVNDMPLTIDVSTDGRFVIIGSSNNEAQINIEKISSGTTTPLTKTTDYFWNITDKLMYRWVSADSMYKPFSTWYYPSCLIDVVSGVASFAKDSNGNDMIFNGAGFMGHHAFVYPNVKALIPNRFNEDGSLRSFNRTNDALRIVELLSDQNTIDINNYSSVIASTRYLGEVDTIDDLPLTGRWYYVKSENITGRKSSQGVYSTNEMMKFIDYAYDGTTVTDFAIRQPYQGARNLLTDDLYKQIGDVETLLAAI